MSVNKVNQSTGELSPISGGTLYADAPVGSIQAYGGSSAPWGWLLCQGQTVSRATYAELFNVIGTSFGAGDGSTTFNVPDLRGKFAEGTPSGGTIGENKAAGLPNITGNVQFRGGSSYNELVGILNRGAASGAVYGAEGTTGKYPSVVANTGTTNTLSQLNVDASRSNSIYGNSTTVQPPAVCVNYIIKATSIALPTDFASAVDDKIATNIVDSITDGNMKAATSNAVYDAIANKIIVSEATTAWGDSEHTYIKATASYPTGLSLNNCILLQCLFYFYDFERYIWQDLNKILSSKCQNGNGAYAWINSTRTDFLNKPVKFIWLKLS